MADRNTRGIGHKGSKADGHEIRDQRKKRGLESPTATRYRTETHTHREVRLFGKKSNAGWGAEPDKRGPNVGVTLPRADCRSSAIQPRRGRVTAPQGEAGPGSAERWLTNRSSSELYRLIIDIIIIILLKCTTLLLFTLVLVILTQRESSIDSAAYAVQDRTGVLEV